VTQKPTSILTSKQRHEYVHALADDVPEALIKKFDERLNAAEERWKPELRDAVRTDRAASPKDTDDA